MYLRDSISVGPKDFLLRKKSCLILETQNGVIYPIGHPCFEAASSNH